MNDPNLPETDASIAHEEPRPTNLREAMERLAAVLESKDTGGDQGSAGANGSAWAFTSAARDIRLNLAAYPDAEPSPEASLAERMGLASDALSPEASAKLIEAMTEGATVLANLVVAAVGVCSMVMPVNGTFPFPPMGAHSAAAIAPVERLMALHDAIMSAQKTLGVAATIDGTMTPTIDVQSIATRLSGQTPVPPDESPAPPPPDIPRVLSLDDMDTMDRFRTLGSPGRA